MKAALALIVSLSALASASSGDTAIARATPSPHADPAGHAQSMREAELGERFRQAVVMLHAKRYDEAATALHRVLELAPKLPEAHVNMGFALLGADRADAARAFFDGAIELQPRQANAYYGLAMALERRGDLEGALGAMRSYLHLSKADDAYRARARAALWEWEERLGRHAKAPPADAAWAAVPPPAR